MKLRVNRRYSNGRESYDEGQVIEADSEHAAWLIADSPGTFEGCDESAIEGPPADKMVRRSQARRKTEDSG
jgi:hypothetical protein